MKTATINRTDTIDYYKNLRSLFEDTDPSYLDKLTEDELCGIDHALDFEDYAFLVINGKTVVVLLDGEVSSIHDLDSFEKLTADFLRNG